MATGKKPVEVNVYDFVDKTNGKESPYGVYDTAKNKGWIMELYYI